MSMYPSQTYAPVTNQPGGYGHEEPGVLPGAQITSFDRSRQAAAPAQSTVVVVNQQPKALRTWASGICDCCSDMGVCCMVTFCAPCVLCGLSDQMGEGFCMPCCVHDSLMALRIKLRTEHGIQGSIKNDHCMSCCCGPCALCQLKREHDMILQASVGQQLSAVSTTVQMA